ncbi:MAG TPA: FAD:protein FMN transferase [Gaiellaceae bacterium]|nr:FAD:protein FMN transferase [Gaiellaceae bacterium]
MGFHSESFAAIGCLNQVTVAGARVLPVAVAIAKREIAALDDACSRFRHDSELARVNRTRGGAVSPLLLEALEVSLAAARATDGLVDPTVGTSLNALGYDRDFDVVVRLGARPGFDVRPATGWRSVQLDHVTGTVALPRGAELDLGATTKAFAADRIANAVHAATGSPVLVSLGGDIAVAGTSPAGGWPVLVTDDSRAGAAEGQVVALHQGGLATSSTTVRRWRAGRTEVHHIVDPRTGASAEACWRTVSVAAPTCVEANTAATAAVVLGPQALRWLEQRRLPARLVRLDGTVATTGGWPAALPEDTQARHSSKSAAAGAMQS